MPVQLEVRDDSGRLQLELRDDSGRLQLDAARHRTLVSRIRSEANAAGIAVTHSCAYRKPCPPVTTALLAMVIEAGPRCRLGLLWRTSSGLRRAVSPELACAMGAVTGALEGLLRQLSPATRKVVAKKRVAKKRPTDGDKEPAAQGDKHARLRGDTEAPAQGDSAALVLAAGDGPPQPELVKKRTTPRRAALKANVGLRLFSRSFAFNSPVKPVNPPSYDSGLGLGLALALHVHPGAFSLPQRWFSDFGLRLRYARALGLRAQLDVQTDAPATFWQLDLALTYRWVVTRSDYSPTLNFAVGLGWMRFSVDNEIPPLPNVAYRSVDLQFLELEQPFLRVGSFALRAHAGFSLILVLDAGPIENADSTGYGDAGVTAYDLGFGLRGSWGRFYADASFTYRRIAYDFDRMCAIQNTGCGEAGGAIDQVSAFVFAAGFTL